MQVQGDNLVDQLRYIGVHPLPVKGKPDMMKFRGLFYPEQYVMSFERLGFKIVQRPVRYPDGTIIMGEMVSSEYRAIIDPTQLKMSVKMIKL